jgi:hypothetical protein
MSTIDNFNRIEDCNKIDPLCIDAYTDFELDPDNKTGICLHTPWGGECLDLTEIVKNAESCTTLYLSPDDNPNCLVYEPEEKCGDNICIHGDDLSRIISMTKLKDVEQGTQIGNGEVYIFNSTTQKFEPYDIITPINNLNTAIQNINVAISNLTNRVSAIEQKLIPPAGAPNDVKVVFGNINEYSDPNVVISEGSGTVTTLDKNHGLYTHTLASDAYGDEIFG